MLRLPLSVTTTYRAAQGVGGGGGGGGKMRLYGLLEGQVRICMQSMWQTRGVQGGKYVSVCKVCGKLGESRACSPGEILILDLLLDTIWWNLGLFYIHVK